LPHSSNAGRFRLYRWKMSVLGTELPIPNVRSSVANGGKRTRHAQCELFAFCPNRTLTPSRSTSYTPLPLAKGSDHAPVGTACGASTFRPLWTFSLRCRRLDTIRVRRTWRERVHYPIQQQTYQLHWNKGSIVLENGSRVIAVGLTNQMCPRGARHKLRRSPLLRGRYK
jgi:hypothetical protein